MSRSFMQHLRAMTRATTGTVPEQDVWLDGWHKGEASWADRGIIPPTELLRRVDCSDCCCCCCCCWRCFWRHLRNRLETGLDLTRRRCFLQQLVVWTRCGMQVDPAGRPPGQKTHNRIRAKPRGRGRGGTSNSPLAEPQLLRQKISDADFSVARGLAQGWRHEAFATMQFCQPSTTSRWMQDTVFVLLFFFFSFFLFFSFLVSV